MNNRNALTRAKRAEKFKPTHRDGLLGGRDVQVIRGSGYWRIIRQDGYEEHVPELGDRFSEINAM
jgi:hypothetical protein